MAASAFSHDQMISAFESRFDYMTARTMLSEVLDKAGVGKSGAYDGAALAKISATVEQAVARPQAILAKLASGGGSAAAPPAAPIAAPKAAESAKAEAKAEAKSEPKAEPSAEAAAAQPAPAGDAAAGDAATEDGADKPAEKKSKKKEG